MEEFKTWLVGFIMGIVLGIIIMTLAIPRTQIDSDAHLYRVSIQSSTGTFTEFVVAKDIKNVQDEYEINSKIELISWTVRAQ